MNTTALAVTVALVTAAVFCGVGVGIGYGVFHKSSTKSDDNTVGTTGITSGVANSTTTSITSGVDSSTTAFISDPTTTTQKAPTWQQQTEQSQSCPLKWEEFPLLLISLDGFRALYLDLNRTKAISQLIKAGSHAPFMYPSFPSVTFPNHYAIVTGLYPESHGIVSNNMYDASIPSPDQSFSISKNSSHNPAWWNGEPIWNTVVKQNRTSATYFWPGSDVAIENMYPTDWKPYNGTIPFPMRVDGVLEWLLRPKETRPSWISLYFDEPDHTGHDNGPDSLNIIDALFRVDSIIDYLMQRLYDADLIGCLNIVLVADHGMQSTKPKGDDVALSDFIKPSTWNYTILSDVWQGPFGRIQAADTPDGRAMVQEIVDQMNCSPLHNGTYRVYDKANMPLRLHYTNNKRIGDLVIDMDAGYLFTKDTSYKPQLGEHGYDFRFDAMHALFVAYGPAFKQNYTLEPFQNVELFNLMADVIKLKEPLPPNNGTKGSLSSLILRDYKLPDQPTPPQLSLLNLTFTGCNGGCSSPESCTTNEVCRKWVSTAKLSPADVGYLSTCSYSAISKSDGNYSVVVGSVMKKSGTSLSKNDCILVDQSGSCAQLAAQQQQYRQQGISLYSLFPGYNDGKNEIDSRIQHQMTPMYDSFYNGVWNDLNEYVVGKLTEFANDLVTFEGPIFDADFNGLADSQIPSAIPTHFFKILVQCKPGWSDDLGCSNPEVLSFVLPHTSRTLNRCQGHPATDFLYKNTARVRDIELATGLEFFLNFPTATALRLRTHINQFLW